MNAGVTFGEEEALLRIGGKGVLVESLVSNVTGTEKINRGIIIIDLKCKCIIMQKKAAPT